MPLCYSCCGVIWFVIVGPLLGLLYAFLSLNYSDPILSLGLHSCYFEPSWPIPLLTGFLGPFLSSWASSAHFLFLDILGPFLILHSHGLLLTFLGFPDPITISFTFGVHGFSINPLLTNFIILGLLWPIFASILPMGLLLLSLGSFMPTCFLWGPFIIF